MNSVSAVIRGYLRFDVNGRRFLSFSKARDEAVMLSGMRLDVHFRGWRPFTGWSSLLIKRHPGPVVYDLTLGRWLQREDA